MATKAQSIAMFILITRLATILTLSPTVEHRTIPNDHHRKSLVENSRRTVTESDGHQRPTTTTTTIDIRKHAPSRKVTQIDNLTNIGNRLQKLFRQLYAVRSREDYIYDQIRAKSRRQRALFEMTLLENMQCQQEELLLCDQHTSNERLCHRTATGMLCCRCMGQLLRDQIQVR